MSYSEQVQALLDKAIESYGLITGIHRAADLLPMMSMDEFNSLVEDVDKNGFLRPVRITDDGLVIDGRNRLCASIKLGKDVRLERFNPSDPIQYVLSENLERRHLTSQQKAVVAVKSETLYGIFAEEARERQKEAGGDKTLTSTNKSISLTEKIPEAVNQSIGTVKTDIGCNPGGLSSKPVKRQKGEASDKLAKTFGTNQNYVKKAQNVKDHAPELLPKVSSGEVDLNDAAKIAGQRKKEKKGQMQETGGTSKSTEDVKTESDLIEVVEIDGYKLNIWHRKLKSPSTFNTANVSIDWAWSTWNPVTGCLHSCPYCYARDIANSDRTSSAYPKGFDPVYHPYRLDAPKYSRHFTEEEVEREARKRKLDIEQGKLWANNVFVCSMADLFGKWVPDEWILSVFDSVKTYTDWNYLFLTKYPQRLQEIGEKLGGSFPDNCWVGTTVDEQKRVAIAQKAFANIKAPVKWLSLEPLLTNLEFTDLGMFDMVAIGGQSSNSQVPAFQPQWKWVENIMWQARKSGTAVYFKENLKSRPKELPI